jgi:hypothetical protein
MTTPSETVTETTVEVVYVVPRGGKFRKLRPVHIDLADLAEQVAYAPDDAFAFFYVSDQPVHFADGTICPLRAEGSRRTGRFFIRSRLMDVVTRKEVLRMPQSFGRYMLLLRLDERECDEMACYGPGKFLRIDAEADRMIFDWASILY